MPLPGGNDGSGTATTPSNRAPVALLVDSPESLAALPEVEHAWGAPVSALCLPVSLLHSRSKPGTVQALEQALGANNHPLLLEVDGPWVRVPLAATLDLRVGDTFAVGVGDVVPGLHEDSVVHFNGNELVTRVTAITEPMVQFLTTGGSTRILRDNAVLSMPGVALPGVPILSSQDLTHLSEFLDSSLFSQVTGFVLAAAREYNQVFNAFEYLKDEIERRASGRNAPMTFILCLENPTGVTNFPKILQNIAKGYACRRDYTDHYLFHLNRTQLALHYSSDELSRITRDISSSCHARGVGLLVDLENGTPPNSRDLPAAGPKDWYLARVSSRLKAFD